MRLGPLTWFDRNIQRGPTYGINLWGPVLQGDVDFDPVTDISTAAFWDNTFGASYSFLGNDIVGASAFVARQSTNGFNGLSPSFVMPDLRSGLRGATFSGEFYGTVPLGNTQKTDAIKISQVSDVDGSTLEPGVQILWRSANKPRYLNAFELYSSLSSITPPTGAPAGQSYAYAELPTTNSVLKLDGNGYDFSTGSLQSWKDLYATANGLTPSQITFIISLEPGAYDGQDLEIICTGWAHRYASYSNLNPVFTLYNNPLYQYSGLDGYRMVLGKEFNGGARADTDYGFDGASFGQGNPYPFPHGVTASGAAYSLASVDQTKWSTEGQFTITGYRTIKLRWVKIIPDDQSVANDAWRWRWVEISRTHTSIDNGTNAGLVTTANWPGDTGYTDGL